jgi:hypothetical protein
MSISHIRERSARWLLVGASALLVFSVCVPLCTNAHFIRWDLATLVSLAWILGTVSFFLKPTIASAIIMCAGVAFLLLEVLK